jgi:hypothetical protein
MSTLDESYTSTTTVDPHTMSKNLEGGPNAKDSLGVKKNVVGETHDKQKHDNSPTTDDVHGDFADNVRNARDEGMSNYAKDQEMDRKFNDIAKERE